MGEWLFPKEDSLYSPYQLKNIKEAAERVIKAINKKKKICISGDPDSDGCNSLAMIYRYLNHFTDNLTYTYCQRSQGHGISKQIVPEDTELLLILDSSTNEGEECERLVSEYGMDIIILDHHPYKRANNYSLIVNPQLCNYPNKDLSGAGVCFKFLQVLDELLDEDLAKDYIDLAGLGIISDSMDMSEPENRYLVHKGLENVKNPGLRELLFKKNIRKADMNSTTFSFVLGPIINSLARNDQIEKIIELLLCDDSDRCAILAKECIAVNEERKKTEAKLFKKVKERIDDSNKIIIVTVTDKDKIEKNYNGLLANKIANYYGKETFVVKEHNELCAGSARGTSNIELRSLLETTDLFNLLEGHDNAFGVEFKSENKDKIIQFMNDTLEDSAEHKVIEFDIEIEAQEIDLPFVTMISKLDYLSGRNCEPVIFKINNLNICERKVMGKGLDTIKLKTMQGLDLMKFKVNDMYAKELDDGGQIEVIGSLNINRWYNWGTKQIETNIQCLIDDYKIISNDKEGVEHRESN